MLFHAITCPLLSLKHKGIFLYNSLHKALCSAYGQTRASFSLVSHPSPMCYDDQRPSKQNTLLLFYLYSMMRFEDV